MKHFFNSAVYQTFYLVKQAYSSLKQKPGFVFSVVTTMGVTLGALLCVLTLAYVMLIKPLPYPEQDKLYLVEQIQFDNTNKQNVTGFSYAALVDFYQQQKIFSTAALIDYGQSSLVYHVDRPIVDSTYITPEWFKLVAANVIRGRLFEESEALNSYNPVTVITYNTWQKLFNGDDNIIGKSIFTRNQHFTIVGVLDKRFIEPSLNNTSFTSHLYFPWDYNPTAERNRKLWWGRAHDRAIIGKILPNMSVAQAESQSSDYVNTIWQKHIVGEAFFAGWQVKIKLSSFFEKIIGNSQYAIYMLVLGAVSLTLIASVNIINLLLARFAQKETDLAIHAALGANKKQLLAQLMSENILLFSLAVIIALVISSVGFSLLQQYLASYLPRVKELNLQTFTLLTSIGLGLFFSFVFSKLVLASIHYKQLALLLNSSGKGLTANVTKAKRKILVVSQITIALSLVFLSSIMALQAFNSIVFDDGIEAGKLQSLQLLMVADELPNNEGLHELAAQAKTTLSELTQVTNVSRSTSPFLRDLATWSLTDTSSLKQVLPEGKNIDEQYFSLSGQRLIAGDYFTKAQVNDRENVLIINEVLANILAMDGKVLGRRLSFGTTKQDEYAFTIIGVVTGHKIAGQNVIPPRVYRPNNSLFSMVISHLKGQKLSLKTVEEVFASVSPVLRVYRLESLAEQKYQRIYGQYITLTVSLSLLLITLFIAAIGLYGILSYSIQMRRFEIGTRLAIGAKRRDILKLIITDNAKAIVSGIVASVVILLGLSIGFSELLSDYLTWQLLPMFLLTLTLISLISFIACYLPLRQYINKPAQYSLRGTE